MKLPWCIKVTACSIAECNNIAERSGLCASHGRAARKGAKVKPKKEFKPIPKVSPKMAAALREYSKLRKQFLDCNHCKICKKQATQVHHMAGRATIELLLDTNLWLAVCMPCHEFIERNPLWAKEKGYSLERLAK